MGLGWEEPSGDPWQPRIPEPKAIFWNELIRRLGESGPRDTRVSDLTQQQKKKVRQRDNYQCRRRGCSSKFDPAFSPGECWVEQGRRTRRSRNQSHANFIGQHLHVHHIIKRENGGRNVPSNLVTLCKSCHKELHKQCGEEIPEREQFIAVSKSDQDFLDW